MAEGGSKPIFEWFFGGLEVLLLDVIGFLLLFAVWIVLFGGLSPNRFVFGDETNHAILH